MNLIKPVLLDTHVWFWVMMGTKAAASSRVLNFIQERISSSAVGVSIISVWEIAILESKKQLQLPLPCREWVHKALQAPGIRLEDLTPEIMIESTRLPGSFHADPADRILVATAAALEAVLVTGDQMIQQYLKKHPIAEAFPV